MFKEDFIYKIYGYRYILVLLSNFKRVLVLVRWKFVLLYNVRKCVLFII